MFRHFLSKQLPRSARSSLINQSLSRSYIARQKIQPKTEVDFKELEHYGTFKASDITVEHRQVKKPKPLQAQDFVFGRYTTDHLLEIDWSLDHGWSNPKIVPYGPFEFHVGSTSLHYGLSCFEGLNILQNRDNKQSQAFRPDQHLNQFFDSTNHLDLPLFDVNELYNCLKQLVKIDKEWFPDQSLTGQLYMRMCHVSTDEALGVATPKKSKIFAFMCPMLLKNKNLQVKCSDGVNKNWPLGHGQYTLAGNLGSLIPSVSDAKENGFDDVLWLLDEYVQEMTILNVFFVIQNRYGRVQLITPPDNGCILPGVTRNSILDLSAKIKEDIDIDVVERPISIHELISAYYEDRVLEVIGCSTSSHIQPISNIVYHQHSIKLDTNRHSYYVSYLNNLITSIMTGSQDHEWVHNMEA